MKKDSKPNLVLPIEPMKLGGKIETVPINKIRSGKKPTVEIKNAIVAFVDILGFSEKTNDSDIDNTLLDFSGSLTITSIKFPNIRYNVFSDNAFLAADQKDAKDLISALRFAFSRWCSNGILVRAGLALGSYKEFSSTAIKSTSTNFTGNLFSGTAVTKSVRLEQGKGGAQLYTDDQCASFLSKKFGEPIFSVKNSTFIGWSNDDLVLSGFIAISLFRLLRILKINNKKYAKVQEKLLHNLVYSQAQIKTTKLFNLVVLSTIQLSSVRPKIKQKACKLLNIRYDKDFKLWNKFIKKFLNNNSEWKILKGISDADSSLS